VKGERGKRGKGEEGAGRTGEKGNGGEGDMGGGPRLHGDFGQICIMHRAVSTATEICLACCMSDANLDYFARLFEGESHDCFVSVKIFHGEEQRPCDAVSIPNSNDGVEEGRVFRLEGASRERRQARRSGRKFLVEERRIMTRLIMISVNRLTTACQGCGIAHVAPAEHVVISGACSTIKTHLLYR